MERKLFIRLVPVEEALRIVKSRLKRGFRKLRVPLEMSAWHVLAEDVEAKVSYPPEPRSTADGYAVRSSCVAGASEEAPRRLPVVERVRVGEVPSRDIEGCEAIEVDTGAVVPRGADAVVPVEYTREQAGVVEVYRPVGFGDNIAWPGSDIVEGEIVAREGQLLTPQLVGALAASGVDSVEVYEKPSVCIVATGVELVEPGQPLSPGKVYEVNTKMLKALLEKDGFEARIYGIVPDDEEAVRKALRDCLSSSDVVLFTGGTSAGPYDVVYRVLGSEGELLVHGLRLKPGKPTAIAIVDGKLVVGLPGNPVSALNVYNVVVRELLWHLAGGEPPTEAGSVKAILAVAAPGVRGRRLYQPVLLAESHGSIYAYPLRFESYMIVTYSRSDGYIIVPEETPEALQPGTTVEVQLLNGYWRSGCYAFGEEVATEELRRCKWFGGGTTLAVDASRRGVATVAILSPLHPAFVQPEGYECIRSKRRLVLVGTLNPKVLASYPPSTSLRHVTEKLVKSYEHVIPARNALMAALLVKKGVADATVTLLEYAERMQLEIVDSIEEELLVCRRVSPGGGSPSPQ